MKSTNLASDSPANSRLHGLLLALIVCLSVFIQFTVVSRTVVDVPLRADASEYFSYAFNLHNYDVYSIQKTWMSPPETTDPIPDKIRTPGYPLFLLLVGTPEPTPTYLYRVSLIQAGLGVTSVLLIYLISANFLSRPLSLLVALVSAISPSLAVISTYLLSESLFLFLVLAGTLSLIRALRFGKPGMYIVAGVIWALCALVRPTMAPLPFLLFGMALALPSMRLYVKPGALALASFLLVMSPWIIRNQNVHEPGPSVMVKTLAHGSYPNFMYEGNPESFGFPYRFDPDAAKNSADLSTVLYFIAGRFREEPVTYFKWYLIGKPYFFLSLENVQSWDILIYPVLRTPYAEDPKFSALRIVGLKTHWPLTILALIGLLFVAARQRPPGDAAWSPMAAGVVGIVIVYAIAFHMIVAPFPRYSIPFRPLLYALAGIPIQWVWNKAIASKISGKINYG